MLRWSNGIARHEIKWCTSSNAASASRFGLLRDEMVFSRALVEQTCLGAPEQHKREPRRPKPVPYTRIRRPRCPGNFWRFLAIFWCFFRPNTIPDKNGEDPRRGSGQECPKGRFSVSGLCVYCQGSFRPACGVDASFQLASNHHGAPYKLARAGNRELRCPCGGAGNIA